MYVLLSVALLVLVVGALVDIITRPDGQVKHLPKMVWILLVIFLPVIGSIVWFGIGREYSAAAGYLRPGGRRRSGGQTARRAEPPAPRASTTEEELAALEREIEFHEQHARLRRLEAELDKRRVEQNDPSSDPA
ncbi:PLD nuclease N-terminal domain-containing protein [Glaciibacter sp. 2TAF33]|uniref:PLD nuclease N-terminal domain-containing protein n=1 Tax=Glaciibacter sp. 2TAF33 TaxID=3233015 RepID=UPI003F8DF52C